MCKFVQLLHNEGCACHHLDEHLVVLFLNAAVIQLVITFTYNFNVVTREDPTVIDRLLLEVGYPQYLRNKCVLHFF